MDYLKYKEEVIKLSEIKPQDMDSDFEESGMDSIMFINLIIKIEEYFGIDFPPFKMSFEEAGTLNQICLIIDQEVKNKTEEK